MNKKYIRIGKIKLLFLFTLVSLVSFSGSVRAFPDLDLPDNEIKVGIREIAPPVEEFCDEFAENLRRRLKNSNQSIDVRKILIKNEYKGKDFLRFQGLLDNRVQLECGPNSVSAKNLINPLTGGAYSEQIDFSDNFYLTNIKLLIKNELREELSQLSREERENKIKDLRIGVLEDTTTQSEFQVNSSYQRVILFESTEEESSLEKALNDLETGGIQALASDGVILQTLYEYGVKGTQDIPKNSINYRQDRPPFNSQGFTVFPKVGRLPDLGSEYYGIAVAKDASSSDSLVQAVNDILNTSENSNYRLGIARENIERFEEGKKPLPYDSSTSDSEPSDDPSIFSSLITLIFIILFLLSGIFGVFRYFWEKFNTPSKEEATESLRVIQDCARDLGVTDPRIYNSQQFKKYCDLWKNLLKIEHAGCELWDSKDEDNLILFASQLRDSKPIVIEHEALLKDSDRQNLYSALQALGEIKVGNGLLKNIFSGRDILHFLDLVNNQAPKSEKVKRIIDILEDNEDCQLAYEQTIESIRTSFRDKLSS